MTLLDNAATARTALDHLDTAEEFKAGLTELMPFLRIFAQSLARHREPAEDLAQEALAKAWRCRDSFVRGSNLKAWLFTVLRDEFYSQQRRAWRLPPWDEGLTAPLTAPREEQQWALELSGRSQRSMTCVADNAKP
jgi:RNA polymerase sigma-70 factor (ECF subfamily)